MDVRFLPNPHFVPELRSFTGLAPAVRQYVLGKDQAGRFLDKFKDLLEFLLAGYRQEGKSYLTVSIGCTGGKHRSVVIVEELEKFCAEQAVNVRITHRDIEKG